MQNQPEKPPYKSRTILAWVGMVVFAIGSQMQIQFPDSGLPGSVGDVMNWGQYLFAILIPIFRFMANQRLSRRLF